MNIIALGGSNSKTSINKKLATYAAAQIKNGTVTILDLNDFELPLFGVDKEQEIGIPEAAVAFAAKIDAADYIVLSLAEHNGAYSAAFKNLLDWTSRIKDRKMWGDKPMLLMATSPGARGAIDTLTTAKTRFAFMGAQIKATFSLPEFYKNFNTEEGITDQTLKQQLVDIIKSL